MSEIEIHQFSPEHYLGDTAFLRYNILPGLISTVALVDQSNPEDVLASANALADFIGGNALFQKVLRPSRVVFEAGAVQAEQLYTLFNCDVVCPFTYPLSAKSLDTFCNSASFAIFNKQQKEVAFLTAFDYFMHTFPHIDSSVIQNGLRVTFENRYPSGDYKEHLRQVIDSIKGLGPEVYLERGGVYYEILMAEIASANATGIAKEIMVARQDNIIIIAGKSQEIAIEVGIQRAQEALISGRSL